MYNLVVSYSTYTRKGKLYKFLFHSLRAPELGWIMPSKKKTKKKARDDARAVFTGHRLAEVNLVNLNPHQGFALQASRTRQLDGARRTGFTLAQIGLGHPGFGNPEASWFTH